MELADFKRFLVGQYKTIQEDIVQTNSWLERSKGDKNVTVKDTELMRERYDHLMALLLNTQILLNRYSIQGDFVVRHLELEQSAFKEFIEKRVKKQDSKITALESKLQRLCSLLKINEHLTLDE